MRKILAVLASVVCAFAGGLSVQADQPECPEEFTIRLSEDYFPFSLKQEGGSLTGIDVTFIRTVLEKVGCPYEFVLQPWKRAIVQLEHGQIDMIPFASITEERLKFARFSKPNRNETAGLVIRKRDGERYKLKAIEDVLALNMRLGHTQGAYRGEMFEAFLALPEAGDHIFNVTYTSQGIKMLINGRIDALVEMPAAALAQAEKMGVAGQLSEHPLQLFSEPVHFMFLRETVPVAFVVRMDEAIKAVIQSDDYKALYGSMAIGAESLM